MDQDGTKRESIMEVHGRIKIMHGDIRVAQWQQGNRRTRIKIKVAMKQLDLMSISHLDGWMIVLGTG